MLANIIHRVLGEKIAAATVSFPVISLMGPRQSGKTTLIRTLFPDYAYRNLENLDDRMAAEEDPRRFLKPYAASGLIVDEAQKVPSLFSYLQGIVDESGKMGKFILTGSQNFLLLENITQSLAGRVVLFNLMPFGMDELEIAELMPNDADQLIFTGGYPVLYDRPVGPPDYFPSYIQTYIERDVRSIKNIGDLSTFQRFVKLCAGRTGQLLNLSSLGSELGINYKTVRSWISVLEASFIVFLLQPHHRNFNKRIVKQPKLYFYDTGLLCALLDIQSPEQVSTHYLRGHLFENLVISEYVKHRLHLGMRSNAFFWRNSTGHEIDLLIETGGTLHALEIKSGETLNNEFFKNLIYFKNISGLPVENLFLVYGGERNQSRKQGHAVGWKNIAKPPYL
ncbi:MAG: ATP-binding protein [Thermodesulfobacteriota bacterium]